jgi:hypothetical protein
MWGKSREMGFLGEGAIAIGSELMPLWHKCGPGHLLRMGWALNLYLQRKKKNQSIESKVWIWIMKSKEGEESQDGTNMQNIRL